MAFDGYGEKMRRQGKIRLYGSWHDKAGKRRVWLDGKYAGVMSTDKAHRAAERFRPLGHTIRIRKIR